MRPQRSFVRRSNTLSFNKYMSRICFVFLSLLLIAIISFAQNETKDGHEFMKDKDRCHECHSGEPVFGVTDYKALKFTEDSLGRSHPVNVRPPDKMEIPDDLHLDDYMNITCATCHAPHGETYTKLKPTDYELPIKKGRERSYRSYYLRRTNSQNALCYACHKR
jgi:hypothetical protein